MFFLSSFNTRRFLLEQKSGENAKSKHHGRQTIAELEGRSAAETSWFPVREINAASHYTTVERVREGRYQSVGGWDAVEWSVEGDHRQQSKANVQLQVSIPN